MKEIDIRLRPFKQHSREEKLVGYGVMFNIFLFAMLQYYGLARSVIDFYSILVVFMVLYAFLISVRLEVR